jgi:hypothetical protein
VSATEEEIKGNQHIHLGRCWDGVGFGLTETGRLVHGQLFVRVQKELVSDNVPVVFYGLDDFSVQNELGLLNHGPAHEGSVVVPGG